MTRTELVQNLTAALEAGRAGQRMPRFKAQSQPNPEQMAQLNQMYEEARQDHRARTLRGRAK